MVIQESPWSSISPINQTLALIGRILEIDGFREESRFLRLFSLFSLSGIRESRKGSQDGRAAIRVLRNEQKPILDGKSSQSLTVVRQRPQTSVPQAPQLLQRPRLRGKHQASFNHQNQAVSIKRGYSAAFEECSLHPAAMLQISIDPSEPDPHLVL